VISPDVLRDPGQSSIIEWRDVRIKPGTAQPLPRDIGKSHYYAARETDASIVTVNEQSERFLFYRGVADFEVPISVEAHGSSIRIKNLGTEALTGVILFENRGGRIGYRVLGTVAGERTSGTPSLDGNLDNLPGELERLLVSAGLYPAEARAMVETWRDSWFEEGVRVFYLVPPRMIESILPLTVTPAASAVTRVFVGRMDVVTPAVQQAVDQAISTNNTAVLERYGRLLGPIADRTLAKTTNPADSGRVREVLDTAFARLLTNSWICE
jgi:hypothetical protein